jgi:hypothetical protein
MRLIANRVILLMSVLVLASGCATVMGSYETPGFVLEERDGDFELRSYRSLRAITNSGSSDNSAFRPLFRYISGANDREEKIAMTVPVRKKLADGGTTLSFFLPHRFSAVNSPEPQSDEVVLEEYPSGTFAVLQFSGIASSEKVEEKRNVLRQWAEAQGYKLKDEWYLDRFDPPWTLWFLRKNELLVGVKKCESSTTEPAPSAVVK